MADLRTGSVCVCRSICVGVLVHNSSCEPGVAGFLHWKGVKVQRKGTFQLLTGVGAKALVHGILLAPGCPTFVLRGAL